MAMKAVTFLNDFSAEERESSLRRARPPYFIYLYSYVEMTSYFLRPGHEYHLLDGYVIE